MRIKRLVSIAVCMIVGTPALAFSQHRRFVHMAASGAKGAQVPRAKSAGANSGNITGTVLDPDGKPVPDATVVLRRIGAGLMNPQTSSHTDDRGRFRFEGLAFGAYTFSFPPDIDDFGDPRLYRPGDVVTLRTEADQKGAVITGTVMTATGEPVIEAPVRATRVGSVDGNRVRPGFDLRSLEASDLTDDRGVYRLWGIRPGSYLVSAGGVAPQRSGSPGPYDDEVPAYYPSGSIANAKIVEVARSQEASGIDIRYVGDTGHRITGAIRGVGQSPASDAMVALTLTEESTGAIQAAVPVPVTRELQTYEIASLPDGRYCLTGTLLSESDLQGTSVCRMVNVKGADVPGADVVITPLASIAGKVSLDRTRTSDREPDCKPMRPAPASRSNPRTPAALSSARDNPRVSEIVISVSPDSPLDENGASPLLRLFPPTAMPDGDGDFAISRIAAGRHHLNVNLPGQEWYLAALNVRDASGKLSAIEDVISVKPAQQLGGVAIAIRTGAAALSGRVRHNSGGDQHPGPMRIYLVPIDQEPNSRTAQESGKPSSLSGSRGSDTMSRQSPSALPVPVPAGASQAQTALRYRESEVLSDGTFALSNLAPGKYKLLVLLRSHVETPGSDRPLTRSAEGRARLLHESKDHGTEIYLTPCSRTNGFVLNY